jgi:hypothetical protein
VYVSRFRPLDVQSLRIPKKNTITVKVLGPNGKWVTAKDESASVATTKAIQKKVRGPAAGKS